MNEKSQPTTPIRTTHTEKEEYEDEVAVCEGAAKEETVSRGEVAVSEGAVCVEDENAVGVCSNEAICSTSSGQIAEDLTIETVKFCVSVTRGESVTRTVP